MSLSPLVRNEVGRRFPAEEVDAAALILEETSLPLLDTPSRARERQRVQLAAIKLAGGDLLRLRATQP